LLYILIILYSFINFCHHITHAENIQYITAPIESVSASVESVSAPVESVSAPVESVSASVESVSASVESVSASALKKSRFQAIFSDKQVKQGKQDKQGIQTTTKGPSLYVRKRR